MLIEKGVEVPVKQKEAKYPYALMNVGDSFLVKEASLTKICNANYREWKKHGTKYTARVVEGGVRVWRVE